MTAVGARPRGGHLGTPRALLDALRRDFPVAQRWVIVGLADEANYKRGPVELRGGRTIELDVGETLYSSRTFAERHGVARDDVRRAVNRAEANGLIARRPAWAAPDLAPGDAPRAAPRSAPPPTIVRFTKYREILWPGAEPAPPTAPPRDPPAAPPGAPIQQGDIGTQGSSSSLSLSCAALTRDAAGEEKKTVEKVVMPDSIKQLRIDLGRRLGLTKRMAVAKPENRQRVIADLAEWIDAEGHENVVEACVHRAYREALKGQPPPDSLAFYSTARVEISDDLPADTDARPSLENVHYGFEVPLEGRPSRFPKADYWEPLVTRMTPMQAFRWKREVETRADLQDLDDRKRKAAWDALENAWRLKVGLPPLPESKRSAA